MLKLKSFSVKRLHIWFDAEFNFTPGITLVHGRNRSGKSYLFRALRMILRAQIDKRGSSLSRLPPKAEIGLNFTSGAQDWVARMTPKLLSLNRAGEDQGSTGKVAAKALLASTLAIPSELFDSTIHVQGTADHPLISVISTPSSRLAWVSSVLDLTTSYDAVAAAVVEDLEAAATAEKTLRDYRVELATIEFPDRLPSVKKIKAKLDALRAEYADYARGRRWLETLAECTVEHSSEHYAQEIEDVRRKLKTANTALADARAYEMEAERAAVVAELQSRLDAIEPDPIPLKTLSSFAAVLRSFHETVESLQYEWANTAADRETAARLEAQLVKIPNNLTELIERAAGAQTAARTVIDGLKHARGGHCPVCRSKLDDSRRQTLIDESSELAAAAGETLAALRAQANTLAAADRLRHRLSHVVEPPAVNLSKPLKRIEQRVRTVEKAQQITLRLTDLRRAAGSDLTPPTSTVAECETMVAELEQRRDRLTLAHAEAVRYAEALIKAREAFPQVSDWNAARDRGEALATEIERLAIAHAEAVTVRETCERNTVRADTLEDKIAAQEKLLVHLPELIELKEAMGRRGLRLTKIRELVDNFVAEFNALIPLLWDEEFVLDIEVKENGIEVFATRNGVRDDLHSLSGSETQGWKAITALALIRLLPDRLRCNIIVLDEIESFMDEETRDRFISNYLPKLREQVDSVVLVSPQTYENSPLVRDASYAVQKENRVSVLRRIS